MRLFTWDLKNLRFLRAIFFFRWRVFSTGIFFFRVQIESPIHLLSLLDHAARRGAGSVRRSLFVAPCFRGFLLSSTVAEISDIAICKFFPLV